MDLNTLCICAAFFMVALGVLARMGYLRRPSPLDDLVAEYRREKAAREAEAELQELAARITRDSPQHPE